MHPISLNSGSAGSVLLLNVLRFPLALKSALSMIAQEFACARAAERRYDSLKASGLDRSKVSYRSDGISRQVFSEFYARDRRS